MALVCVHGPLRKLAGRAQHDVAGSTVAELLHELELAHPALSGWIVDERGVIRRHINVFVNGELGDAKSVVSTGDRVEVLPAITGGRQ